jgi:hypothetical protein
MYENSKLIRMFTYINVMTKLGVPSLMTLNHVVTISITSSISLATAGFSSITL